MWKFLKRFMSSTTSNAVANLAGTKEHNNCRPELSAERTEVGKPGASARPQRGSTRDPGHRVARPRWSSRFEMRIIKHRPRPDVRVAQPPSGRVPPLPSGWRDHFGKRRYQSRTSELGRFPARGPVLRRIFAVSTDAGNSALSCTRF